MSNILFGLIVLTSFGKLHSIHLESTNYGNRSQEPSQSNDAGPCVTVGGPSAGKPCIFPFVHRGQIHFNCIKDSDYSWCSTEVDKDSKHTSGIGRWGKCGKGCPLHSKRKLLLEGNCSSDEWFCNNQCISKANPCEYQCPPDTWRCYDRCIPESQPCMGYCIQYMWLCNEICISTSLPCDNIKCPRGSWKCYDNCFPLYKPCKENCPANHFLSCSEDCLADDSASFTDKWMCHGKCQNFTEPCEKQCALTSLSINCNGKCESRDERSVHLCQGHCLNITVPCLGHCPLMWQHLCHDKCQHWSSPCDGVCPRGKFLHSDKVLQTSKCPNEDKCLKSEVFCQSFYDEKENHCLHSSDLSKETCENPQKYNITVNCTDIGQIACTGHRSSQCIYSYEKCDGYFDCIDRSDESNCPNHHAGINYSVFNDCSARDQRNNTFNGFLCKEDNVCLNFDNWCKPDHDIMKDYKSFKCLNLLRTSKSEELCSNFTFWEHRKCNYGGGRCSGNRPGECKTDVSTCSDKSHLILKRKANNEEEYEPDITESTSRVTCQSTFMYSCHNNNTCIHQDLVCDGYVQCSDASDEDPDNCGRCPIAIGFPPNKLKSATFSCKHKFSGRPICAVPYDGEDDLCFESEDEKTEFLYTQTITFILVISFIGLTSLGAVLIIIISTDIKRPNREADATEMSPLCDNNLLSSIRPENNFVLFSTIHNSENYASEFLNLLNQSDQLGSSSAIFSIIDSNEKIIHANNDVDYLLCKKNILGTKATEKFHKILPDEDEGNNIEKRITKLKSDFEMLVFRLVPKRVVILTWDFVMIVKHLLDIITDLCVLITICILFLPSRGTIESFATVSLAIMSINMIMPYLQNMLTVCRDRNVDLNIYSRCFLAVLNAPLASSVSRAVLSYLKWHRRESETDDSQLKKWKRFYLTISYNESSIKEINQTAFLLIVLLIKQSETNTLTGLQEFFVEGNTIFVLISLMWSFISILIGKLERLKIREEGVLYFKGYLLGSIFIGISLTLHLFAIVIYFTPSLGLMNILQHWKVGGLSVRNGEHIYYDVGSETKITFEEIWKPLSDQYSLTWLTNGTYFIIFCVLLVIHIVLVLCIKIWFHSGFKTCNWHLFDKLNHLFSNMYVPSPFEKWDLGVTSKENALEKWNKEMSEIKILLILFFIKHVIMGSPLILLTINMHHRNILLNDKFPLLTEESYSTRLACSLLLVCILINVILPILQYWVYKWFTQKGQMWSKIIHNKQDQHDHPQQHQQDQHQQEHYQQEQQQQGKGQQEQHQQEQQGQEQQVQEQQGQEQQGQEQQGQERQGQEQQGQEQQGQDQNKQHKNQQEQQGQDQQEQHKH